MRLNKLFILAALLILATLATAKKDRRARRVEISSEDIEFFGSDPRDLKVCPCWKTNV